MLRSGGLADIVVGWEQMIEILLIAISGPRAWERPFLVHTTQKTRKTKTIERNSLIPDLYFTKRQHLSNIYIFHEQVLPSKSLIFFFK